MAKKRYDKPETKRAWDLKNREKILAQQRERRRKNPERTAQHLAKYKAKHPEKIREIARAYYANNKEEHKKKAKDWRSKNLERHKARTREWRSKNPEKMRAARAKWERNNVRARDAYLTQYRLENRDALSIRGRKRYRDKKDEILEKTRAWQKANPHVCKQIGARRRARIKGASIGDTRLIATWEADWRSRESVKCAYCHNEFPPDACDTDHIIPISRPEIGGVHALHNLTIACAWCNRSKGNRTVEEWNLVKLNRPKSNE